MLTTEHRAEIRNLIENEIQSLDESIQKMMQEIAPEAPDAAVGRISRMDSMVNKETLEMAMVEAQKRLGRLHDKLEKIDDPDFGRCARCGEWIQIERLRAAPDRGVCVSCLQKK